MNSPGPGGPPPADPALSAAEREEVGHLAFFVAEVGKLADRGLIPDASRETILAEARARREAVERSGRARGEVEAARRVLATEPEVALARLDRARVEAPDWPDPWALAVEVRERLGRDEEALALCEEACARLDGFPVRPEVLRARTEARRAAASQTPDDSLAKAREALNLGRDAEVIALCEARLADQPDHFDSLVLLAFARQRLGHLFQALPLYKRLRELQPDNPVWVQWATAVEERVASSIKAPPSRRFGLGESRPTPAHPAAPLPAPVAPGVSWSQVAGEFLHDHWQKLILCLAVLLIVVSTNIGAYQLLGPRLWSPVGKCVLALIYTAMFAGFGTGLVRWGAERAGRIMLLTTLIMVPANFLLAGEMKLLTEPSVSRLLVLAVDAAALLGLVQVVGRALGLRHGRGVLTAALLALSASSAAASPGLVWPWGWHFAFFLAPGFVFLAAVAWLLTRFQRAPFEGQGEVTDGALALFAFAFLTGLVRAGVFTLQLPPTLYAVPLMLGAVACVFAAPRRRAYDPDPAHESWLRFAGLVLSAVGLALALVRPPLPSAVFSGNTLAAALLGLGLYAALLRAERKPAYLYFGFGALFLAYFGAFYFTADLLRSVKEAASRALGYRQKLPPPFKAINGLVFSTVLALLAVHFRRAWNDPRLARHCHYIGVPFSIAACVFSAFEPTAGLICLGGYALLYSAAARFFAEPRLVYLAAAAFAGAAWCGSARVPGVTLAHQALGGAMLALGYWAVAAGSRRTAVGPAYRRALEVSALGLAGVASVGAVASALPAGDVTLFAAGALGVASLVGLLFNRDARDERLGYAVTLGASLAYAFAVVQGFNRGAVAFPRYALAAGVAGLVLAALGDWSRRLLDAGVSLPGLAPYRRPFLHTALVQVGIALLACGVAVGSYGDRLTVADLATLAGAFAGAAGALVVLTRAYPSVALAHLAMGAGLGCWVCGVLAGRGGLPDGPAPYGAAVAAYALALVALEEAAGALARRRKGTDPDHGSPWLSTVDLFGRALPRFEVGAVLGSSLLAAVGWANEVAVAFTFGAGAAALFWATRFRRSQHLVTLALALAVTSALSLTAWRVGWSDHGLTVGWLALVSALAAVVIWGVALVTRHRPIGDTYTEPCLSVAAILTWAVFPLALFGRGASARAFLPADAALLTNALALLALTTLTRRRGQTYRALFAVVCAVYLAVFSLGKPSSDPQAALGLVAVLLALPFAAAGFACRYRRGEAAEWLYTVPLFRSSLALTVLAVSLAYHAPAVTALAALSFLVLVKAWPARGWLYPAVAAAAGAVYFAFLSDLPQSRMVTAAMVGAYQLWLLGLFVRRFEPALRHGLRLPATGYDRPILHSAVAFALLATGLRVQETWDNLVPWSGSAGLALNLAVFCLLMVKAFPRAEWVHLAVVLFSGAAAMTAAPYLASPAAWLVLGMGLANAWCLASRGVARVDETARRHLGLPDLCVPALLFTWSQGFFAATSALLGLLVLKGVVASATQAAPLLSQTGPWLAALLALGLAGAYLPAAWWWSSRDRALAGLWGVALAAVWWAGVPTSPLWTQTAWDPHDYLTLTTAVYALLTFAAGLRLPAGGDRAAVAAWGGVVTAGLAVALSLGWDRPSTVGTLFLVTAGLCLEALVRRRVVPAYAAGLSWSASAIYAALWACRAGGITADADRAVYLGVALLGAVAGLWLLAAAARRSWLTLPEGRDAVGAIPARTVALAFEHVALVASFGSAAAVLASTALAAAPSPWAASAAVGSLFLLALFHAGMIGRWGVAWLVYPAQASLVGSYLYYRWAFPLPVATDALVLTLFGYLDLGLAEVMSRAGLGRLARPTRYVALVLPLLPLLLAGRDGSLTSPLDLFLLLSAATFYAVAGYRFEWKWVGYASAVLYNSFLWFLWGRFGWALSDHPHFFLVPVGFSAILFAEANVKELGRQGVNAVRGIGLLLVYLSLAAPVWQAQSFGAWLVLLLVSLAGIFAGIALRAQTFLWLGLVGFVVDVGYQLTRVSLDHSLARWGIMLVLGVGLILFVALNEKKKIVVTLRDYLDQARGWE